MSPSVAPASAQHFQAAAQKRGTQTEPTGFPELRRQEFRAQEGQGGQKNTKQSTREETPAWRTQRDL